MKLLVIGAGTMGPAAAYDMARSAQVESVTLADINESRAKKLAERINRATGTRKVAGAHLDASSPNGFLALMRRHVGILAAVPSFFNVQLCRAALSCGCHFADLGGDNATMRLQYSFARAAADQGIAIAPGCGLSPGMTSILAGELLQRVGGKADAIQIYVGNLPEKPKPPFNYQLLFNVEGLVNTYAEPAAIMRKGEICEIEPLTEPEDVFIPAFPPLVGFHTSGGSPTLPESFKGKVRECFEKTLRYPGHYELMRGLYDLGFFSNDKVALGSVKISPREFASRLFAEKFTGKDPDVTVMCVEAHNSGCITSFTLVDRYDPATKMTSMMRTTAWPASIVLQMICSNQISKRGCLYQERDVPARAFIDEMESRGVKIECSI